MKVALVGCGAVAEALYAQTLSQLIDEGLIDAVTLVDPRPVFSTIRRSGAWWLSGNG